MQMLNFYSLLFFMNISLLKNKNIDESCILCSFFYVYVFLNNSKK